MAKHTRRKPPSTRLVKTTWFIGFTDGTNTNEWWFKFLKRGFRHVYMYTYLDNGMWIILEMSKGGLIINFFNEEQLFGESVHHHLKCALMPTITLAVSGMVSREAMLSRGPMFTCVEMARSILGIDKFIVTPFKLFKYLVKNRKIGGLMPQLM